MSKLSTLHLVVEDLTGRVRLEEYLFERFPNLSRMYIRDVIRTQRCEVNGRIENKGKRVRLGDFIEIELDLDRETGMRHQNIPLRILHEDEEIVVVDKPAGMLVHPTHRQKNGTLLNALSFHLNRGNGSIRPGLVHRLDKDTSGIVVVAKTIRAHRILARQFQKKTVKKRYAAIVEGVPEKESGTIEEPIGRFADEKRWGIDPNGSYALTRYRVIKNNLRTSLIELEPVTGRTNQLRIHCAWLGHPIVGDVKRGGRAHKRLCLHSSFLRFEHPTTNRCVELTSEIAFGEFNDASPH